MEEGSPRASQGPAGIPGEPYLSIAHLTVRRDGLLLLDDVSFEVRRGGVVAIVGPNGAGKTTLLRALLGVVPYRGTIRWAEPVRFGYVPQKLVETDIPLSVREFLSMKCPADYRACLATVGLDPSLLRKTLGVLSGGEIQRILIAWAIVDRPQVLLFDEPTSNVDTGSQDAIFHTLRRVQQELGETILLVTHDVHAVHHFADQVIALRTRLLFTGSPTDLLRDHRLLTEAFGPGAHEELHPPRGDELG